VKLNSVEDNEANLTIKKIKEAKSSETNKTTEETEETLEGTASPITGQAVSDLDGKPRTLLSVLIILIVAIAVGFAATAYYVTKKLRKKGSSSMKRDNFLNNFLRKLFRK
jgi:hypothetical protein